MRIANPGKPLIDFAGRGFASLTAALGFGMFPLWPPLCASPTALSYLSFPDFNSTFGLHNIVDNLRRPMPCNTSFLLMTPLPKDGV